MNTKKWTDWKRVLIQSVQSVFYACLFLCAILLLEQVNDFLRFIHFLTIFRPITFGQMLPGGIEMLDQYHTRAVCVRCSAIEFGPAAANDFPCVAAVAGGGCLHDGEGAFVFGHGGYGIERAVDYKGAVIRHSGIGIPR